MSRAGGVTNGVAVAVEAPKPHASGLGRRMNDSDAAASIFSEQLAALEVAASVVETGANPLSGERWEIAAAEQNRKRPHKPVDVVEPKGRLIPVAQKITSPLDEATANEGRAGATHPAAIEDSAAAQRRTAPPVMSGLIPAIGDTTVIAKEAPESAAQASRQTAGRARSTGLWNVPDARPTAGRAGNPNPDAGGGASGVHQPAGASPTSQAVARAINSAFDRRSADRAGDVPVRVLRHETHLPPAERLSPATQIANAVAAGLHRVDNPGPVRAAVAAPPEPPTPARVVQVLQVRLEPPELGTVTVRMRLDGNTLEVRIDARQPGTADQIRSDQGALTRLLQSAGYDVDMLTVHVVEPDRSVASSATSASQSAQSAPHQNAFQANSGSAQPDGRSGGPHQHANRQNEAAGTGAGEAGSEPPGAGVSRSGGIYV